MVYCNDYGKVDLNLFLLGTTSSTSGGWQIKPDVTGGVLNNNELLTSALPPDVYSLKYALGNSGSNCRDSDSVSITILPILDPTVTLPSPDTVCSTLGTLPFVNTGDGGGLWSVDNGGSINSGTGVMTLNKSGTFLITYLLESSGSGLTCPIDSTVELVVKDPKDPTITDPGMICAYDAIFSMSAQDAGGVWSGTGVVNNNEFNPGVNGNPGGTVTITYGFTGTCPVDDTHDFVITPVYDATITNAPLSAVCITDNTYSFTSVDGGGSWSSDDGGIINAVTGELDLTLTKGGLFNIISVSYTHLTLPTKA